MPPSSISNTNLTMNLSLVVAILTRFHVTDYTLLAESAASVRATSSEIGDKDRCGS